MKSDWKIPHSSQHESAVLGAALDGGFEEALDMGVGPDHFHGQIHKKIWNAAAKLADAGSPVNIMTVKDSTEGCGMLLNELLDQGYSPSMLGYYVPKLEETRLKRSVFLRYYNALEHFSHDMSAKELLQRLENDFYEVTKANSGSTDQKEGWKRLLGQLEDACKGGLPDYTLKTGIGALDAILGGFEPSSMNTLAARPGCGKTAFAIQIMKNAAQRDDRVVYWSYEMGFDQIASRLIANVSGEDIKHFKETGHGDINKIATASSACTRLPITIEDKTLSLNRVRSMARRMAREKNVKLFILDYLQIITASHRYNSNVEKVSDYSRTIKMLAMETGVPVLCLSQMNRQIDMSEREPSLSDLRESGAIEQDSDTVSFLHQPDKANDSRVDIIVRKNRHGRTGKVELEWTKWNGRFSAVDRSKELTTTSPL